MSHEQNHSQRHVLGAADELRNPGGILNAQTAEGTTDITDTAAVFSDADSMEITMNIQTGRAIVIFSHSSSIDSNSDEIHSRIKVGAVVFRGGSSGRSKINTPATQCQQVLITGLSQGNHTFKGQWLVTGGKTIANNASTSQDDNHRRLVVVEI